jgi:hypothetical protein
VCVCVSKSTTTRRRRQNVGFGGMNSSSSSRSNTMAAGGPKVDCDARSTGTRGRDGTFLFLREIFRLGTFRTSLTLSFDFVFRRPSNRGGMNAVRLKSGGGRQKIHQFEALFLSVESFPVFSQYLVGLGKRGGGLFSCFFPK